MKYLGKKFLYETVGQNGRNVHKGTILNVEFNPKLGPVFTAISPSGNKFRVTKKEIKKIIS